MVARSTLVVAALVVAVGCSSSSDEPRLDGERREVRVQVETLGDRSVAGLDVRAELEGEGEPRVVFEVAVTDELSVNQPTCEDAKAMAIDMAEGLAVTLPAELTCNESTRAYIDTLDIDVARTNDDGVAVVEVIVGQEYKVGSSVQVVAGDDGCHFNGIEVVPPDVDEVTLRLDSNGCE